MTALSLRIARHACPVVAGVLLAGCMRQPAPAESIARRAVATLEAVDGYVFIYSPFNCSLTGPQIDAINALAARRRRSGTFLTVGFAGSDDTTTARVVQELGIRMKTRLLASTPLRGILDKDQLRLPVVIAVRGGEVIGMIAGSNAERLDTWIDWIEQRSPMDTQ